MAAMEGLQIFTLDRQIGACGPLRSLVQNPSNGRFQPFYDIRAGRSMRRNIEHKGRTPVILCACTIGC